ncbi:TIGR00282 family metallophosphoesterase [Lapidilactobacillus gannanensis]|uniref:TIGR00282 family metallophosphoesterase n=1 Tax=Lapidilactobacillus gannanensis TaxID=2486002 RepID=A0ABW4BMB1_9LACO|nr:TIGR00282 family metallophosphoesterase [Lapidilactobacillus gannanensis]
MRVIFIGDVMGEIGQTMLTTYLPKLKSKYRPQLTIVNGENIASGKGITRPLYKLILQAGADVVTMGNHTFDKQEIFEFIDEAKKLVRPANYPAATTPGQGYTLVKINQVVVGVINLQGRVFINPIDDPFAKADELVKQLQDKCDLIFVDFHAETTSEKLAMAWYLDGRVAAVIGTHTHVQTNDARILPKGTAYLTDAGMTGPYNEILGMNKDRVIEKFRTNLPVRFETPKSGPGQLNGCYFELDEKTGRARKLQPFSINPDRPFLE